jgi:hypothetical protein
MEGRSTGPEIDMAAIGGMVKAILIKTLDERCSSAAGPSGLKR